MEIITKPFSIDQYETVLKLWQETENIELSETDELEPMRRFLDRNPGLSLVAYHKDTVVGTLLCSHDGRRGYMHHLAVKSDYRNKGIGSTLVQECLKKLSNEGIYKCNTFILDENNKGMQFWEKNGFIKLPHFGWMQSSI